MHLLRTQPGGFVPDDGIAHLAQTPAELVILCSGDSHLALLAEAARALPDDYPSLRLANPMQLQNHASVDLYVEEVLRHARVILLSLHGGIGYWRYGVEQLVALAERGALLIPVPGDDRPDPELSALGNLPAEQAERFWQYLRQGGLENAGQFYRCLASQCLGRDYAWREPQALPRVALFHPRHAEATLEHWRADWQAGRPVVALLFYRTHLQAANTAFIARFCERLAAQGLNPLPIALASLKESACLAQVEDWLERSDAALIVNTTGFAQSNPERPSCVRSVATCRYCRRSARWTTARSGWTTRKAWGRATWPCTWRCRSWTGASSPGRSVSRAWPGAANAARATWSAISPTTSAWISSPNWRGAGPSWRASQTRKNGWRWCWPTTRPAMAGSATASAWTPRRRR